MLPSTIKMLNAIIGSCKNEPHVPNDLYNLGYQEIAVEKPIGVKSGNVVPDLAIASAKLNSACCLESKTGPNIENAQAQRYAEIEPEHIQRFCAFALDYPATPTVDVSYVCPADPRCVTGLGVDLDRIGLTFPLLAVGANIALHRGAFRQPDLHSLFSAGLNVDWVRLPEYYRFDKDTPLHEMAPHVITSLVAFATQGATTFTTAEIAGSAYGEFWRVTGEAQKREVISKVGRILQTAMATELAAFLTGPTHTRIGSNAAWSLSYRNATGGAFPARRLKTLQQAGRKFTSRLKREEQDSLPGLAEYLVGDAHLGKVDS